MATAKNKTQMVFLIPVEQAEEFKSMAGNNYGALSNACREAMSLWVACKKLEGSHILDPKI
jgi:hypothetical protein